MPKKQFSFESIKLKYFNLYECCLLTKGFTRSIVVDPQRNFFYFIPNDLYEIIELYNRKRVDEICSNFEEENQMILIEYLEYLFINEIIFFTEEKLPFTKISTVLDFPFKISNAVIDFRKKINFNLAEALNQLQSFNTHNIQFRIYENGQHFTEAIIKSLHNLSFEHVEILQNFENKSKFKIICDLVHENPIITLLSIYNAPQNVYRGKNRKKIFFHKEVLSGQEMCGVINTTYFNTNLYHFAESLTHNTCLKGKISIDENGLVKHCPSMKKDYGAYSNVNLINALKDKTIKKYSNINKNEILVCKDCEFRNICTDCRVYIEDVNNIYSKPKKCNYDPYTCTWHTS